MNSLPANTHRMALLAVTATFFMWGFISKLGGAVIPALQGHPVDGLRVAGRPFTAAAMAPQ